MAEALFTDIPLLKLAVDPLTVNPLAKVPNPAEETVNKVDPPLLTVNALAPVETEADTVEDAILDKLSPVIPDAGMPVKNSPDPENTVADDVPLTVRFPNIPVDPVNNAGPIFVNVLDPETVKDPVMIADPETIKNGLTIVPELVVIVPGSPWTP